MREYEFCICDVFTTSRFGGNQLAVLPHADGLTTDRMQQIAREFNFSESTFVLPGDNPREKVVRIFTPTMEVPFAGHPNVGTAFVLAGQGSFGEIGDGLTVVFREAAGDVRIDIAPDADGLLRCELEAPQALSTGETVPVDVAATALSLDAGDIVTTVHEPVVASVGLPFLVVELASRDALERARANVGAMESLRERGLTPDIHFYWRDGNEYDIRARMYAPLDNVPEDPATGSANCALVALLTERDAAYAGGGRWRVAQGVEMGRPSVLEARTRREGGRIRTWIGGNCVLVAHGRFRVD